MIVILAILWLFQVVLLDEFYHHSKVKMMKDIALETETLLQSPYLDVLVQYLGKKNDACIRIVGEHTVTSDSNGCMINNLPINKLKDYVTLASENGNEAIIQNEMIEMMFDPHSSSSIIAKNKGDKNVTFVKIVNKDVILVNTNIARVSATTKTLQSQLQVLSLIFVVAILGLVTFLNKKILRPILRINEEAKRLSMAEYNDLQLHGCYFEAAELNDTLVQVADQLKKAETIKRDLIGNISHDLRTPLTMISGYGELMRDFPEEMTSENCTIIINEAKRLSNLVNELLEKSKSDDDLSLSVVEMDRFILSVCKMYENCGMQLKVISEGNTKAICDEAKIAQVLHNVISNAIDHSIVGSIIEIRCIEKSDCIEIGVKDNGEGFDESQIPFVFERYYQVNKNVHGSGIGLAIVKEILEKHHSTFSIHSKVNEGTVFTFTLEKPRVA